MEGGGGVSFPNIGLFYFPHRANLGFTEVFKGVPRFPRVLGAVFISHIGMFLFATSRKP